MKTHNYTRISLKWEHFRWKYKESSFIFAYKSIFRGLIWMGFWALGYFSRILLFFLVQFDNVTSPWTEQCSICSMKMLMFDAENSSAESVLSLYILVDWIRASSSFSLFSYTQRTIVNTEHFVERCQIVDALHFIHCKVSIQISIAWNVEISKCI